MKFLKAIFLIFTFLASHFCEAQKIEIDKISFYYQSSLRIPFNNVSVEIYKREDGKSAFAFVKSEPANDNSEWKYSNINTHKEIEIENFNSLKKKISLLEKINFDTAYQEGGDGNTCKLEFSAKGHGISYEFWSPNFETDERGLTVFVETCKEILKLVGLNDKEVLED